MLDETVISRAIIETYMKKLTDNLSVDVAIVGAGPSGLVAGYYLARAGRKVAVFERALAVGGGMWGGGMGFNEIVVQEEGRTVLDDLGIPAMRYQDGYYTIDSFMPYRHWRYGRRRRELPCSISWGWKMWCSTMTGSPGSCSTGGRS